MTRAIIVLLLVASVAAAQRTPGPVPDGMPFGRIGESDVDHLQEFALKRAGFDLKAEMARVYSPDNKLDEEALARVFAFSQQFNTLDHHARTYGQIICSSLLNIGEVIGVPAYVRIIDRQPPDVQQRIRDFLWYPAWQTKHEQNSGQFEGIYPGLFPKSYRFGRNDPIFANER
jgi:hypothetical protein